MRYRNKIAGILSGVMLLLAALPVAAAAETTSWRAAYAQWLSQQDKGCEENNIAILCDLDFDGIPELFWGGGSSLWNGYFQLDELHTGITMINRKIAPFYQVQPAGVRKDDPNYHEMIYLPQIMELRLVRNRETGTLHLLSPFVYRHGSTVQPGEIRYVWRLLDFSAKKMSTPYESLVDVTTAGEQDGFGHGSTYLNGYIMGSLINSPDERDLSADEFFRRLEILSSKYQILGNPALTHIDTPEDMKSGASTAFWTQINGQKQCNIAAIQQFLSAWSPSIILGDIIAQPANVNLLVDSQPAHLPAYRFYDSHYVKLRDLAALLSGTAKPFDVVWDGSAVQLTSGKAYPQTVTAVSGGQAVARYSPQRMYLDGKELAIPAYQINGHNYVRLREIAAPLGIPVGWNQATETITLQTK